MNRRGFLKGLAALATAGVALRLLPETKPAPTDDGWDVAFSDTSGGRFGSLESVKFLKSRKVFSGRLIISEEARRSMIERQLRYQASKAMRSGCISFEQDMRAAGFL